MDSLYFIQSETLGSMADAIRAKGRTSSLMTPAQMVGRIEELQTDIPPMTFKDDYTIREFTSNVTYVLDMAFMSCYSLSRVNLPSTFYIAASAFENCHSLNYVSIPKMEIIGLSAFARCIALREINLPNVTHLLQHTFLGCTSLVSVSAPVLTYIGILAFQSCYSLASINLPLVKQIDSQAFASCSALTSISLPSATTIGGFAFCDCPALTSISLPSATKIIGSYNFESCYNLLRLYLTNSIMCILENSNAFYSTPIAGRTTSTGGRYGSIYVPASLFNTYRTATNWTVFSARFVSYA